MNEAVVAFREAYGTEPEGVWAAPGRVNLIGEHTDYNDGFVLPFALEQTVTVAAAPWEGAPDGALEVSSLRAPGERVGVPPDAEPGSVPGWAAYPAGVLWALRDAGHKIGAARLVVGSDLPDGAGLSSSAALECATALALTGLAGIALPGAELARLAQRAENVFVGMPCGILDQSASLLSTAGHLLLLDTRDLGVRQVPFAADGLELLLVDTRVKHSLVDGEYAARRASCEEAARRLGVRALRDAGDLSALTDPVLLRRARHVVGENARVERVVALLEAGRAAGIGPLLTASHVSLRDDFEVSCPELDAAVAAALAAGALGARMTGGGFGGSVIALVPADAVAEVAAAVALAFAERGWAEPHCRTVTPSAGARRVR
ncbi:galactokinase [Actinomadura namibiensis]|uniref:Galactokinase n=1 Tax=Actinomadura namibiensis TaxID=182080 RepID=A0A7W3LJ34_ACTNM|nr:galactokinase [Actinomadura namibiensis]MBA8949014.1 galactokinase [Actinomadura namibiensis]